MPDSTPADLTRRFILENLDIRGQVVRLGPLWRAILARREYPESVRQLLGEFSALAVLIAAGLKHPGRAVLQVMGHGPVSMAVADCTHELALRAMLKLDASFPLTPTLSPGEREKTAPLSPGRGAGGEGRTIHDFFPTGRLALTIENHTTARHFQSIVPLEGTTLAECFEHYFDRSEQVPTHLWVHATADGVGALILQKLPRADERDPQGWARVQRQAAQHARFLLGQLGATSLTSSPSPKGDGSDFLPLPPGEGRGEGNSPKSLGDMDEGEGIPEFLTALFPDDDVRLYKPFAVKDGCTRSEEKVVSMLRGLGRAEVEATLAAHGVVTVHDEICNHEYHFTAPDVARIFES